LAGATAAVPALVLPALAPPPAPSLPPVPADAALSSSGEPIAELLHAAIKTALAARPRILVTGRFVASLKQTRIIDLEGKNLV
jgi:hypothetical protein